MELLGSFKDGVVAVDFFEEFCDAAAKDSFAVLVDHPEFGLVFEVAHGLSAIVFVGWGLKVMLWAACFVVCLVFSAANGTLIYTVYTNYTVKSFYYTREKNKSAT